MSKIEINSQEDVLVQLKQLTISLLRKAIHNKYDKDIEFNLELPVNKTEDTGFFAMPTFAIAKQTKKNPKDIAVELAEEFDSIVKKEKIDILNAQALNAYVNIFVSHDYIANDVIKHLVKNYKTYLKEKKNRKNIVIEFSSPNIAKPFGIGHLRSTIIGNSLYKVYHRLGYNVIRMNHLGDWGTQFGKLLLAYEKWGDEQKLIKNPIDYLFSLYVKFHSEEDEALLEEARSYFMKLENNDPELLKTWELFKELSLEHFKNIYQMLDVDFDYHTGESFYVKKSKDTLDLLKKAKLVKEDEGALIVDLEKYDLPNSIVLKSNGTSTYFLRDLTSAIYRIKEFNPKKLLYVVGNEQSLYFTQLFKTLELMGYDPNIFEHVKFGLIRLPEGKMSTRKGKIVLMEDVLDKVIDLAKEKIIEKNPDLKSKDMVAKAVGISGIFFGDLSNDRVKDIMFDWDRLLDFEGDTGPYILYSIARAISILEKSEYSMQEIVDHLEKHIIVNTEVEKKLVEQILRLSSAMHDVVNSNAPHKIAKYAIDLARTFNEFYHSCPVIGEEHSLMYSRIVLTLATKDILDICMQLLGIKTVRHM